MSSDFGIIQLDKKTLKLKTYQVEDGISFGEFNRISHCRGKDGRLFFGSQNGVTAFYPKDFWSDETSEADSKLIVYEFKKGVRFGTNMVNAMGDLRSGDGHLRFSHDTRTLNFKLMAPDFFRADNIKYAYRLISKFDNPNTTLPQNWVTSNDNEIQILGINPGRYELTIEARATDGEVVGKPIVYQIDMPPPFTHTNWFRLLLALVLIGGAFGYYRWRVANLKNRQILLEQLVHERSQQVLKDQEIIEKQAAQIRHLDTLLNDADAEWIVELDEVVRQKLQNFNLNIAEIADEMNISRTHFFRKIKTVTGLTPNQYLQEARLREAKSLLEVGRYSTVKAVSLSVGFKNSSYFSRLFKERFGHSPSDYFSEN